MSFDVVAESLVALVGASDGKGDKDKQAEVAEVDGAVAIQLAAHAAGKKSQQNCLACDHPKKASVWCERHRRVYECIYRQATGEKAPTEQKEAFIGIFGVKGKGMKITIAVRVILDFSFKFPAALEKGGSGAGKQRGKIDLCAFIESEGTRDSFMDEDDGRLKMDYEAFVIAMGGQRNWSAETAHSEWRQLDDDSTTPRDHKGLRGALRLHIPSNYFAGMGVDRSYQRTEQFQQREMQQRKTFQQPLSSTDRSRLRDELSKGFSAKNGPVDRDRLRECLPAGSFTSTAAKSEDNQSESMTDIMKNLIGGKPSGGEPSGDGAPGAPTTPTSSATPGTSAGQVGDIGATRNKTMAKANRDKKQWQGKLKQGLLEADHIRATSPVIQDDIAFMNTLNERVLFVSTFFGIEIRRKEAAKDIMDLTRLHQEHFEEVPIDWTAWAAKQAESLDEEGKKEFRMVDISKMSEADKKQAQDAFNLDMHKKAFEGVKLGLRDPPCESPTELLCAPAMQLFIDDFNKIQNAADLDQKATDCDIQLTCLKQLKSSMQTAGKDLQKQFRDRAREAAKLEAEEKRKEEEKAKTQKEEEETLEKKRLSKGKCSNLFQLNFGDGEANFLMKRVDLNAADYQAPDADKPCIVTLTNSKLSPVEPSEDANATAIQKSMHSWKKAFPTFDTFKKQDRASAPLYDAHGKGEAIAFFRNILTDDLKLKEVDTNDYPTLTRTFSGLFLFCLQ